jgi:hypothetical protein
LPRGPNPDTWQSFLLNANIGRRMKKSEMKFKKKPKTLDITKDGDIYKQINRVYL